MDDALRAQRDFALRELDALIRRGREIRQAHGARRLQPSDERASEGSVDATRAWQQASATAIHQLSGGSKAHWLSRAFSGALLIRSPEGGAVVEAGVGEIVDRILDVLEQAAASLVGMDDVAAASSTEAPPRRRFEFVHNVQLRPVLEQAFVDSGRALETGHFQSAFMTACGVLEAIITDALEHAGFVIEPIESAIEPAIESTIESAIRNPQSAMTFEARIAAAERAGLIRGGCARLPPQARTYRDLTNADGQLRPDVPVSERDVKVVRQVLHIVMRDLDPGR